MAKHGRLIDADALDDFLFDAEMKATKQRKYVFASALNTIRGNLAKFPTIEPEQNKGKWKRRLVDGGFNADWHCSECGWRTSLEEHGYNYCPNCGSDMRGNQDENN